MTLELGALIVTGTCSSDCCGAHFEHDEESQIQNIKDIIKE